MWVIVLRTSCYPPRLMASTQFAKTLRQRGRQARQVVSNARPGEPADPGGQA